MAALRFSPQDEAFMRRALVLARRGKCAVSPNPLVGAVLVSGRKIIGEGWHKKFGGPHAEVAAIASARRRKNSVKNSILYVNLEPCVSFRAKKTQPCVSALVAAGVACVKIAAKDPNPPVNGRGVNALRKAGIKVETGCLETEAKLVNEKFIKWISTGIPFVGMKVAMSLDGKIATRTGDSKWITGGRSRRLVHELRDEYDAILVGAETALRDNPMLKGKKTQPKRIILDSKLRVPLNSNIFRDTNVIVVTTIRAPRAKIRALKKRGIQTKIFPKKITLPPLLRYLGSCAISSVFVEGGAEVFGSFIDAHLVDRFFWFIAPKIIGGREAKNAVAGAGIEKISNALPLLNYSVRKIGSDVLIEGSPALF